MSPFNLFFLFILLTIITNGSAVLSYSQQPKKVPEFKSIKEDSERFLNYYQTLKLNPKEQKVLERALSQLKAPCCSDSTALTC